MQTTPLRVLTERLYPGPGVTLSAEWAPRRPLALGLPFWALFTHLVLSASGGSDGNDLLQMTSAVYGGCCQSSSGSSARGCAGSPPPPRPVPAPHCLGIKAPPPPRPPSLAQLPGARRCLLARGFYPPPLPPPPREAPLGTKAFHFPPFLRCRQKGEEGGGDGEGLCQDGDGGAGTGVGAVL